MLCVFLSDYNCDGLPKVQEEDNGLYCLQWDLKNVSVWSWGQEDATSMILELISLPFHYYVL